MAIVGEENETFSLMLWLHRDSIYDSGSDLPAADYDPPLEKFAPVARALGWLESPWKLATTQ